ncbi:MAG: ABC transporter substrate-binding protein [Chloroflexi bacterium]|nr:ABC transporter substrate-binding protein [Chloroflexota bacterium]
MSTASGPLHPLRRTVGLSRRELLRAAAVSTAAVALGGSVFAAPALAAPIRTADAPPLNVQLLWIKNVEFAGYWLADDQGMYPQAGVAPNFLAGGPDVVVENVVAGGGADVGVTGGIGFVTDAIAAGSDFVVFATSFQTAPSGLLSLASNPIRTPQDLVGKKIGAQQGARQIIDAIFSINGLPAGQYTFIPVGFDPAPLVQGDCDVYTCFITNQPLTLKQQGIDYVTATYTSLNFPDYADILYAKRSFIANNRDALIAFIRGSVKGWQANIQNPDPAVQLAVNKYGADLALDPTQQAEENAAQIPLLQGPLTQSKGLMWLDPDFIAGPIYSALKASGRTNLPDVSQLVDVSLLTDAFSGQTTL